MINKTFELENGITLKLQQDRYTNGNNPAFFLVIDNVPQDKEDEYFVGEPWTDVSVNLIGLAEDEVAIDNDFRSFCSPKLITDVLDYLVDKSSVYYRASGFVDFPVYRLQDSILNELNQFLF